MKTCEEQICNSDIRLLSTFFILLSSVSIGLKLTHFFCVYMKEWTDMKLRWNPDDYLGITTIRVPSDRLWLPDVVLYDKYVLLFMG